MKTIKFTFEGHDYELGYSRKTIQIMENAGFSARAVEDKPMTLLPQLFSGAFLLNHKHTKQELIDRILENLSDKDGLYAKLIELYNEPLQALFEEPEKGNVTWTVS